MKTLRGILALTILLASGILVACDEEDVQKSQKLEGQPAQQQEAQASQKKDPWVWPGDLNVASQGDLTQLNIMIVYDDSGSMADGACGSNRSSRYEEGVYALQKFIDALPEDANVGFLTMNRGIRVELGTGNRDDLRREVINARPNGGTPIRSSMRVGYDKLTEQGKKQLGYGRYILLVVTDGAAGPGENPYHLIKQIIDLDVPIEIHAVGMCMGEDHSLRQEGWTFYTPANDTAALVDGLKSVLAEADDATVADFKQ
jgi:hypothetical protein